MARPVQLAPGSLALVLCRLEAQEAAGHTEEAGGRAIFRAFRRANARCFWNARLARAASRLAFQGWLRRGVLLVHAPPACLQVLRDAWRRRALRPPRGFCISAVGDVFPVEMAPIAQSQFVPLAEVLCCAVSDMNAAQTVVTQESLLEHLMKHYPGITVPSQDILYTTLGALIKDRKIYHTGEGYFIVTPHTYFVTTTTTQENRGVSLPSGSRPGPTSLTYLVSAEGCAGATNENAALVFHCQSCQCFPDVCTRDVEPPPAVEVTRKCQKDLGQSKPLVQNQAVSVSEENDVCDSTKPLLYSKDKEKGKKFGFSLWWRSISRREKPKAEYSSFSAQFPPEEWPVRDEDDLDNIPRDVEHEIIKRINPVLTIDNLNKHTVLMQKYEEQKKINSQGTSTDVLTSRQKYPLRDRVRPRQGRPAKPHRRSYSHRDRHKARSQGSELQPAHGAEQHPELPAPQPTPRTKIPNEAVGRTQLSENSTVPGSHLIYKKRISNPFQGLSLRGSPITKGHSIHKTSDIKLRQIGPRERPLQRSQSWDSLGLFDGEAKQLCAGHADEKLQGESIHVNNSVVKPIRDGYRNILLNYSQSHVLQRNGSTCCSFRESRSKYNAYGEENDLIPDVLNSHAYFDKSGETKDTQHIPPSPNLSSLGQTRTASRSVDQTIHQFQNLGLLDYPVGANHLQEPEQDRDSEEPTRIAFVQDAETGSLEHRGLPDEAQALSQDEVEGEDGACSSLYLEDDDFSENDDFCQMLPGCMQFPLSGRNKWNYLEKQKVMERSLSEYNSNTDRFVPQMNAKNEDCKPTGLLTNPGESQKPDLSAETHGLNSGTPFGFNCEEEPGMTNCSRAPAPADGSVFGNCNARKATAEAESLGDLDRIREVNTASWSWSAKKQETRKHFKELFNGSHMPVLAPDVQHEHSHLEGTETHSVAGDSGIDSPRTQSLASNSVVLDGLKRRQNFLQEGMNSSQTPTSSSLLQLTPVINV
ncbi:storkhead-box protein 1 [Ochotona princeps]|uniref:storkhead-box protein 1 n=1 Tax=Ochotona princeps TaxID=9978 RepID=UPI002714BAD3|nr:storkhead-box protein 1 [Ochotona princeps]